MWHTKTKLASSPYMGSWLALLFDKEKCLLQCTLEVALASIAGELSIVEELSSHTWL